MKAKASTTIPAFESKAAADAAGWSEIPRVPDAVGAALTAIVEAVERRTVQNVIQTRAAVEANLEARNKRIDRDSIDEVAADLVGMADLLSGAADAVTSYASGAFGLRVLERLAREMAGKLEDAVDRGKAEECGT